MKILMINPPIRTTDKPRHIPHGLAILANMIQQKLLIVPTVLDINAHRYTAAEVYDYIKVTPCDVVLISGLAPTYRYIVNLSKIIRQLHPQTKIIVGGSAALSCPEVMLQHSEVDVVCTGEGEKTLIDMLQNGISDRVNGIMYKSNGGIIRTPDRPFIIDLDKESAMPAYDLLPMQIYLANPVVGMGRDVDMITSRGCVYNCSFCYQPWGRSFRAHSVEFVVEMLKYLVEDYAIDFVSFQDDEFMTNIPRVEDFCRRRNKYLPDLRWSCNGRANITAKHESTVKLMRQSGCTSIGYGFESGSPRMLESMGKNQTVKDMEKAIKINRKYGLAVPASFILGLPGEDEHSYLETIDFALRNNISLDSMMFATPYPGTRLCEYAVSKGLINDVHGYMMKLNDARDFTVNLTYEFSDAGIKMKLANMKERTAANYEKFMPPELREMKLRALYGDLLDKYPVNSKDDEHRRLHGCISQF